MSRPAAGDRTQRKQRGRHGARSATRTSPARTHSVDRSRSRAVVPRSTPRCAISTHTFARASVTPTAPSRLRIQSKRPERSSSWPGVKAC
jgi:hypothetical protein